MTYKDLRAITYFIIVIGALCLFDCAQLMGDTNPTVVPQDPTNAAQQQINYRSTLFGGKVGQTTIDINNPSYNANSRGNYWDHLRSDFQLPSADNQPQVQSQILWFMHNKDYFYRTISHAGPYMYYILQQAEQRNLPGELVLLPVLESDYNPFAKNPSGALGMWQLMRDTASGFGVKEDFWFDGRRDIYASTNAALDYLTYLQSYFGDNWLLAIAAYDTGEGNVQNAIRKNEKLGKPTDFWSLSLAAETRSYVPRLLAIASIIRNPAKYGFVLPPINDRPYLAQIDIGVPINLSKAAQMANMSLDDLKRLNPGYSHTTTDPNGPYKLILPIDRVALFKQQISNMHGVPITTWGRYKIQHGDTIASIAKHFNTTADEIREANHLKNHSTPVGKVIMIPTGSQTVNAHLNTEGTGTTAQTTAPVVKDGVTINKENAANANNPLNQTMPDTGSNQLTGTNDNNSDTDTSKDTNQSSAAPKLVQHTHTVKRGETFSSIAKHIGVSTADLRKWNKSKINKTLKPGTQLIYWKPAAGTANQPGSKKPTNTKKPAKATHSSHHKTSHYIVKTGDNISKIAKHLGVKRADLQKWNHLSSADELKPGQHLIIH